MTSDFDFSDLTPQSTTLKYRGRTFTVNEPTEAVTSAYRNVVMKAIEGIRGGSASSPALADARSVLVAGCLTEIKDKGDIRNVPCPVSVDEVKGWSPKVVGPVFEWCKRAGEIDVEEETEESLTLKIKSLTEALALFKASKATVKND